LPSLTPVTHSRHSLPSLTPSLTPVTHSRHSLLRTPSSPSRSPRPGLANEIRILQHLREHLLLRRPATKVRVRHDKLHVLHRIRARPLTVSDLPAPGPLGKLGISREPFVPLPEVVNLDIDGLTPVFVLAQFPHAAQRFAHSVGLPDSRLEHRCHHVRPGRPSLARSPARVTRATTRHDEQQAHHRQGAPMATALALVARRFDAL